jgi:hypothetical protein
MATKSGFGDILVGFLSFLVSIPLFMIAHRNLPEMAWPVHLDRILLFIVIISVLLLILRLFKPVITVTFIIALGWLAYGSITGNYGFENLYRDTRAMVYSLRDNTNAEQLTFLNPAKMAHQNAVLGAIDVGDPSVRNFAIEAANESFREQQRKDEQYRTIIQSFAIFKKINNNWNYVSDPQSREYFAKASESVKLLAGDCDDHSILMAAAIKSIGGIPRLVYTTGHIYPEIFIGNKNDLERVNYLINRSLFPTETTGKQIHYHEDGNGRIWLNLDYTADYPGGEFFAEPVLGIIYP